MNILGINSGHDAAACIVVDGIIVADAAEERFTRVKHDAGFPINALTYCLREANLRSEELDLLAVAGEFLPSNIERWLLLSPQQTEQLAPHRSSGSRIARFVSNADPHALPLYFERFRLGPQCRIVCVGHHLAHAASAHFTSGVGQPQVIATLDGIGDNVSTAVWIGEGSSIVPVRAWGRTASMGWFYGNVTEALGWQHGDGEGTTMALACYGDAGRVGDALDRFHPMFQDGELITPHDFGQASFVNDHGTYHWHFAEADDIRILADRIGPEHVAARAQQILEQQVVGLVRHWTNALGVPRVATAGGVFLNVKLNQRIRSSLDLQEHWTYPNPGDAGLAVGAALWALSEQDRSLRLEKLPSLYFGPRYSNEEIRRVLDARRLAYTEVADPSSAAATLLANGYIVAWFQGRLEAGPRALGGRSILVAAGDHANKDKLNSQVKFRESFRPFCPTMLYEWRDTYLQSGREEPFMMTSFDVTSEQREKIPAVVHVDGTIRPQTIRREANPLFYDLIRRFGELTGEYLVLNTSFNVKGEPIVCSPRDALRCFFDTGIDALVIGNYVLVKPGTKFTTLA